MKLLLAILPSHELQQQLNSFRKRFDPNYIKIPPHVQFYPSFTIEEKNLPTLITSLEDYFQEKNPFILEILRFSSLFPVTNLIYCKLTEDTFYKETNSFLESLNYISRDETESVQPLITIASNLSNVEHADLLGRIKLQPFCFTETVTTISLFQQLDDFIWKEVTNFKLK